jgi:uncharacterized protein
MKRLKNKIRSLEKRLQNMKSIIVAYSGGLDSTFLSVVGARVLGKNMLAVTARSPALSSRDWRDAQSMAKTFGFRHETVSIRETRDQRYLSNPKNRCYYCKSALFTRLLKIAKRRGFSTVADGTNADDLRDYRPGLQAGYEYGVRHPLQECKFTKNDVRHAARQLKIPLADKPASPCLASRFPYGTTITEKKLRAIDALETTIRRLGFRDCRARVEPRGIVRLEVPEGELKRALDINTRKSILAAAQKAGFAYAVLDLAGLRSGNLNFAIKSIKRRGKDAAALPSTLNGRARASGPAV